MSGAIRPATIADLEAVWAIETAVFGAEAWSRDMMREELTADHRRYVVMTDGDDAALGSRIVGYGGVLVVGEDADIQTIALTPEVRGAGRGRALMDALLDHALAQGVREVFLEVRADNPVARGLYESIGFTVIDVRRRYYQPDNVDALVMRLRMRDRRDAADRESGAAHE